MSLFGLISQHGLYDGLCTGSLLSSKDSKEHQDELLQRYLQRVTLEIIILLGQSSPVQSQRNVSHHVALVPTEPSRMSDLNIYKVLLLIYPLHT